MDTTQRQVMKAEHYEDESRNFGWYLFSAIVLIAGGLALFLVSATSTAKVGGGMLMLIGVALVVGAIFSVRSSAR